jgi:hypothetical protein
MDDLSSMRFSMKRYRRPLTLAWVLMACTVVSWILLVSLQWSLADERRAVLTGEEVGKVSHVEALWFPALFVVVAFVFAIAMRFAASGRYPGWIGFQDVFLAWVLVVVSQAVMLADALFYTMSLFGWMGEFLRIAGGIGTIILFVVLVSSMDNLMRGRLREGGKEKEADSIPKRNTGSPG